MLLRIDFSSKNRNYELFRFIDAFNNEFNLALIAVR